MNCRILVFPARGAAIVMAIFFAHTAEAATVWSDLSLTFTRLPAGGPELPENQDRITDNVWLTRDAIQGIFNIAPGKDPAYDQGTFEFPSDTLWATALNNPGETIEAANFENLDFTFWFDAYEGGANMLPSNLIDRDAVVHLLTDDIYLDLRFTSWGVSGVGGFSYMRAVAPTSPTPTGDYNGDGTVNAADYTVWRNTLGEDVDEPGDGADGNGSGSIDFGDYEFWKEHYGEAVVDGGGLGMAVVPEPATVVSALMLLGTLAFAALIRSQPVVRSAHRM